MKTLTPYHFAPVRAEGFVAFHARVKQAGGHVCFDLEDSVQGPDAATTRALKAARRRAIAGLSAQLPPPGRPHGLGLRLNPPDSAHYAPDLALVRQLPPLACVFVPKVETPAALAQALRELPATVGSVVPVIESVAGFAQLAAILAVRHPAFTALAFGHCDYNLSGGHFPFHHQTSPRYWAWIRALDAAARRAGKQLLNSPVLQLDDDAAFARMLARARPFASLVGQITLCLAHTRLCAAPPGPAAGPAMGPAATGRRALAAGLVRRFERHRLDAGAFALDGRREVISPHEYAAARRVLLAPAPAPAEPCTW